MTKKILFSFILFLVQTVIIAGTITYTGANGGDWNIGTNWSPSSVPTADDDVVIPAGKTVVISDESVAKSISLSGVLTINHSKKLTVYGNVDVASGAQFNAGVNSSDSALILVYGNFTNAGTANFWKSTVVIGGDLITASTILQNNGNIVVGGNVSGVIGGTGGGVVFPVNPNAIVSVTGSADEKAPGTQPTTGDPYVYMIQVIYGGDCPFSVSGPSNVSVCQGTNATFTVSTSGSSPTYQWQVNSGSGWVDLTNSAPYSGVATATLTITSPPVGYDKYKYRAKITSNTCTKNGNYGTLSVINSTAPTPTVLTITQPNCTTATGSVLLNSLPTSGTWNLYRNGTLIHSATGGSGSYTVSGLTSVGSPYTFTLSNATCTSAVSVSVVIASATNTWNVVSGVGSWSNGTPTSSQALVFASNYSSTSDLSGCSCIVNSGVDVIINSGNTLTITNGVTVTGSGTLTFDDAASLVQINDAAVNSGAIKYKRNTASVLSSDYTYWSSPVANQNLTISPSYASGLFYSYDDFASPEDWKKETAATTMQVGKGYIIRGPVTTPAPPSFYQATFVGVPNNGVKTIAVGPVGTSNLIGNPYPSALDAEAFLDYNASVLEGTIYFWTHKTPIQSASGITDGTAGSGAYAYTSNDYAAYNAVGGSGTGSGQAAVSVGIVPSGKIAAGQSFFSTRLGGSGIVTFNNSMRVAGTSGNNAQFFKTKNSNAKTASAIEKHRVWLNLTNAQGAFKQTLLGYVTGATNDNETRFDGESFDGNEFVDFYSVNQDKNLVIQGRALPFDENDEVPLGYRSAIEGTFSINIQQVDGLLANQSVYLEDKLVNVVHILNESPYTFTTETGTFNDRFVLRYKAASKTLATTDFDTQANKVLVSVKNKQIKINSSAESVKNVVIYDASGSQIYQKDNVNSSELLIANLVSSHQVLIVKTTLQNDTVTTSKIVY